MSYNQKSTGPSGSSGGSAPNGPNNQTPQQVAKTLAGIQQQMQNLVHGQNALPQSASADLNAFFQQQRFQNIFKQQQQQLLQQHFQQQIQQQQNKDRGGGSGGEPLALTRTPAAAELLNKTYQQHHQQQANGSSSTNPTLASVNQQIQQQLQAFPPNIMQQLQAFQYQIQQQQHPQQQQHLAQSPLQQVHQQSQSGQSQHLSSQQQLHGQAHQQQQKALTTAAAHMQQLQQSLQQKYLSAAAAAAGQPVGGAKTVVTPPPPPLTNSIKPSNLPTSTQITSVPSVSSGSSSSNATGTAKSSLTSSSLTASTAQSKQVPPSISLVPSKSGTSPTISSHQANKVGTITNKPFPMVSSIPPPFPTHYQKPSNTATLEATNEVANLSLINSTKNDVNAENTSSKSYPTEVSSLSKQQMSISTDHQTTKPDPIALTSIAVVTLNTNQVTAHSKTPANIPVSLVQQSQQKPNIENLNKSVSIHTPDPPLKDHETSKEALAFVADDVSLKVTAKPEEQILTETQALTPITNKSLKILQETDTPKNASTTIVAKVVSDTTEVSSTINATKENVYVKEKNEDSVTIYPTSKATQSFIVTPEVYLADDVKDDIKEKPIKPNSEGCQNNINKCIDKSADVDDTKCRALDEPGKPNKTNQENVELIDSKITPKSSDDNIILLNAPMSSALEENTQIKRQDIIYETKHTNDHNNMNTEKAIKTNEPSNEVLDISIEKEEIKIASPVTVEYPLETKTKKPKSELVKVNEHLCTSAETPKRKHGQQPRTSKTSFLCSTSESGLLKRSLCEDRRILKQKPEDPTESPSPLNETQKSNDRKSQRHRLKTILYQSPLPELAYITKLSASEASNSPKPMSVEDKLIVFYKNEYMAVRNAEGTFYLCQTMQNVYRTSPRISIRWLSEDKKDGSIFIPDFYDHTDIECVLTTVELKRVDKGQLRLPKAEKTRIESILKKAIDVEKGLVPRPDITEENPDGLDISLYKDESQIEKKSSAVATPSSSSRRYRRSGGSTVRSSSTLKTERTLKKDCMTGGKNKSPNKKRKTFTKKIKAVRKNSSDEDVSSDEESDAEYKPNQKKTNTSSASKAPRAQRSPLAKARAASPITPTSLKTNVPHTSSSSTTANSRIVRTNKRKSTMEISIETAIKKFAPTNPAKTTILKSKVDESSVTTTTNIKSYDTTHLPISDNSPSTSADAAAASGFVCSGTRPTRNRK